MKFAVIASGGKQYLVQPEQQITVEKLDGEAGATLALTTLAIFDTEGTLEVGAPELNKLIPATIVKTAKDKKVTVIKYKNKTRYRRKIGHRQILTTIKIGQIA